VRVFHPERPGESNDKVGEIAGTLRLAMKYPHCCHFVIFRTRTALEPARRLTDALPALSSITRQREGGILCFPQPLGRKVPMRISCTTNVRPLVNQVAIPICTARVPS